MAINSRQKGAAGEREWANWLKENLGTVARRGQQFSGGSDSPDVVCSSGLHWEVKRVEKLNIYDAVHQAERDCGDKVPVVAHKKNRKEWLITLRAKDIKKLAIVISSLEDHRNL